MPKKQISELFQIHQRYLRSVHLERDFLDTSALNGYILTDHARSNLQRLSAGLTPSSGQRAWRITGDYGSGKSSFALVLAHLLSEKNKKLPYNLKNAINFKKIGIPTPQFLPVLVTGSRESLKVALLRSLFDALANIYKGSITPKIINTIRAHLDLASREGVSDNNVVKLVLEANSFIHDNGKGTGLLLIIDELGKFLEFAALYPDQQDVYFLQKLAEATMRSGSKPLFLVGLLHQGFNTYAEQLSQSAQKEWMKVAGRFDELLFNQPLEQIVILISTALNIRIKHLPEVLANQAERDMKSALNMRWYGSEYNQKVMVDNAARLYPLHPTVLPVLVKLFSRFGQNERSLFSFLLSNEPFGLQEFSNNYIDSGHFYQMHNLYDYIRTNFGHLLGIQSYRSRWNLIDSVIDSFPPSDELELKILKTIGLLNLLDTNNLLADEEIITLAVTAKGKTTNNAKVVLQNLQKKKHVIYFRGIAGGYCLWPYSSVNLEKAYGDASKALSSQPHIANQIQNYLATRPLVARKHYITTGNLRYFEINYCLPSELDTAVKKHVVSADGIILIPLCETESDCKKSLEFINSVNLSKNTTVVFAIPKPLKSLAGLINEVDRWEWIMKNTPELNNDSYAAEEVTRQISASRRVLKERIQSYIGFRQFTDKSELQWFYKGEPIHIHSARELLSFLSNICEIIYNKAPKIHNELVNRRSLSSAAIAARMRLIERMFNFSSEHYLGMDPDKAPPEMSIYLSVLKNAGLHKKINSGYALSMPDKKNDICNVIPALEHLKILLEKVPECRIKISELIIELKKQPYGLRDGIIPIFIAFIAKVYEKNLAFYENEAFMRNLSGEDFPRIIKAPETFEVQYCRITEVRSDLFKKLDKILGLKKSNKKNEPSLLDIVKSLCLFAAKLPLYTHNTKVLSKKTLAVRDVLMKAEEPALLLFNHLPDACGFEPFNIDKKASHKNVHQFSLILKDSLDELDNTYPVLLKRIKSIIAKTFDLRGNFQKIRDQLANIAEDVLLSVTEPNLKAFCLRLVDRKLSETEWLESLGCLVSSKPPSRWNDSDEELFKYEFKVIASKFRRVEATVFSKAGEKTLDKSAVRIVITKSDGSEAEQVLHLLKDEEHQAKKIEAEIIKVLEKSKRVGLAAASRAFWKVISEDNN